ncbi:kelch-like protein 41b isoform X2 [Drosophila bipectinata]
MTSDTCVASESITSFTSTETVAEEKDPLNKSFSCLPTKTPSSEILMCKQPQKTKLSTHILRLLSDSTTGDFKVYVGKYKFLCHLTILQLHSKYFRNNVDIDTRKVQLPADKVTPSSFYVLYSWMLDKRAKTKNQKCRCCLVELYSAAKFLAVEDILEFCWTVASGADISGSRAVALFLEALSWDIPEFKNILISRIGDFFLPLVASREFVKLDIYSVRELLSMNSLGVNSEIEIFMSGVRWLSHDWVNRAIYLEMIMECVRFFLLPPPFLRYLVGDQDTHIFDVISKNKKIVDAIYKVFVQTSAELCDLAQCAVDQDLKLVEQRNWIYNPLCPYHREPAGNQGQFFTYQQFLDYLETLHDSPPVALDS